MNASNIRNKFDVVDDTTAYLLDIIFNCILTNLVAIFGIVGNIFNILILRYQGLGDSINMILMSLSIVDLALDISMLIRRMPCIVARVNLAQGITFDAYMNAYTWIPLRAFFLISSSHIVLISAERFFAITFPLSVSKMFTLKWTKRYLIAMYVIWIAICMPWYRMFDVSWVFSPSLNTTIGLPIPSQYWWDNEEIFLYMNLIGCIVRGPISVTFISFSSVAIIVKLRQAQKVRSRISSSAAKVDPKILKMLLTICLVYLAIGSPPIIPAFLYFFEPDYFSYDGSLSRIYYVMDYINDFLLTLNSSVNFVIYVTVSSKFASAYSHVLGRCYTALCLPCTGKR